MYRYLIIFRWSQVLQKSLNFGKQPVIDCPVAKWSTPKPSNETFIESKWKHRPLLAIDLDDISIIEPQAGPVRLNRDIQVINICMHMLHTKCMFYIFNIYVKIKLKKVKKKNEFQFSIWAWLCLVMVSFVLIIFFYLQFRGHSVAKERVKSSKARPNEATAPGRTSKRSSNNRRRRET